jgi:hypothetical protein
MFGSSPSNTPSITIPGLSLVIEQNRTTPLIIFPPLSTIETAD